MADEKPCLILVVDDEEQIEGYIQELLQRQGYEQVSFVDPEKALEFFRQNAQRIGLIISDIRMPGIDGVELTRRAAQVKKDIQVILLSGYTDKLVDAASLPNVRACLEKPVLKTDLIQTVEGVIDGCTVKKAGKSVPDG